MNLATRLFEIAKARFGSEHILSLYEQQYYTLGDYEAMAEAVVTECRAAGVAHNTVALLIYEDSPVAIGAFLGCIKYGVVPVLVSNKINKCTLRELFALADPALLMSGDYCWPEDLLYETTCLCMKKACGEQGIQFELISRSTNVHEFIDANQVAYLGMTSGSSGLPKLVMHSHKEMIFASENYAVQTLKLVPEDVLYSVPKMNFTYGMANNLFFSFISGAPAILDEQGWSPENCMEHIVKERPTCFFAVPAVYRSLYHHLENMKKVPEELKGIRMYVSAGEALSSELVHLWYKLTGHYIVDSVGCSETGSAFLVNLAGEAKIGSAGAAVLGYHVHLLQENPTDKGTQGVLCVKSESNAIGYYRNPEETAAKFLNDWLKTGDVFRVDEDGYYWFVGREDSLLKYNGMWIVPEQIEKLINEFPGVKENAVFKTERTGKSMMAAVLCVSEKFEGIQKLGEYLKERLESYKCPKIFRLTNEIPLSINGKRDHLQMQKMVRRRIITIDGPAKLGKSAVAKSIAQRYKMKYVNAGMLFRFLAWGYRNEILSEADMDDELVLLSFLEKAKVEGDLLSYMGQELEQDISTQQHAMETAILAQKEAVQMSVLRYLKKTTEGQSIVVEGRNMGADVFPDADLKVFLTGNIERQVWHWCEAHGYDELVYRAGVDEIQKRNKMDTERTIYPMRKAEDAIEICVDEKELGELLEDIIQYLR